ncbi:MAG: polysaccharide biosynthesis tyrosine autokinase [Deltaproteobacteria bacterium]|nr:polysaccharide biosynthesis tyrosine autokinase [Deltaproteobacteria bacterium]
MGKFFEALKKAETARKFSSPRPTPRKVVKIPTENVEALKLDTRPPRTTTDEAGFGNAEIDSHIAALLEPASPAAECFRVLRAKLLVNMPDRSLRTIMVSSPEPLDGKTLVAANLAVTIAHGINEHVMLVDCDLRRPSVHQWFGMNTQPGIREYLEQGTSLAPYLLKTPERKLTLLAGGKPPPNPSELLSSEKMRLLVEELKGRYENRYIILDAPPAQFTAETSFLASMVDGVLLVVRFGKTSGNLLSKAIDNIGRERIIGVVFNADLEGSRSYRYYYKYYQNRH